MSSHRLRKILFPSSVFVPALLFFSHHAAAQLTIRQGRLHQNAVRFPFVGNDGRILRGPHTSTEWTLATSWLAFQYILPTGVSDFSSNLLT
jgi:hypothetical protein